LAKSLIDNLFSNATRKSSLVTPDDSLAGAVRLRLTALCPEVLKKEALPHNQNVFLDMSLKSFSPNERFGKPGSPIDLDKMIKQVQRFTFPKSRLLFHI
jgi:hypothetical protein